MGVMSNLAVMVGCNVCENSLRAGSIRLGNESSIQFQEFSLDIENSEPIGVASQLCTSESVMGDVAPIVWS